MEVAEPLDALASTRGPEWIVGHIEDPEMIAPGLREPPSLLGEREVAALVAYVQKLSGHDYPGFDARTEMVGSVYARYCVGCHVIDGEGGGGSRTRGR